MNEEKNERIRESERRSTQSSGKILTEEGGKRWMDGWKKGVEKSSEEERTEERNITESKEKRGRVQTKLN